MPTLANLADGMRFVSLPWQVSPPQAPSPPEDNILFYPETGFLSTMELFRSHYFCYPDFIINTMPSL